MVVFQKRCLRKYQIAEINPKIQLTDILKRPLFLVEHERIARSTR
jgi:hypothetical protein